MRRFKLFALMIGAIVLVSVPASVSEQIAAGLDDDSKHILGFAGLTFLAALSAPHRWLWRVAFAMAPVAFVFEAIQMAPFIARYASMSDALCNGTGWVLGMFAVLVFECARLELRGRKAVARYFA